MGSSVSYFIRLYLEAVLLKGQGDTQGLGAGIIPGLPHSVQAT